MKNKKAFTLIELLAVIIIVAIISVFAITTITKNIGEKKSEISDSMKEIIISANELYMSSNRKEYPNNNGNVYCVTLKTLVEKDYLNSPVIDPTNKKEIDQNKYIKTGIDNGRYTYDIVSECKEIRSVFLVETLKQQYKDSNTVGLLKDGSNYYYKGTNAEVANNFVWYEGHLWRVIQINSDNTITMVTQQPITAIQPASSVWTTQAEYNSSYINTWLNNVFYNSISDKSKIKQSTFNVGIYNNVSEITSTQYVGLLDNDQYTRAGLANSFLDIKDYFGIGNRCSSSQLLRINYDGSLGLSGPASANGSRPVIKISDLTITSGNGTLSDPFRETKTSTNTSNVKVGEYISVPGSSTYCSTVTFGRCLFRVVSKDGDSVKVILNGLLPTISVFDSSNTTFSASSTINTPLVNFANSISTVYRYSGNKTFNIGVYGYGANYTAVSNTTYSGNVGLPVVGEMFSGNDIDVENGAKTFVNGATIESPTISSYFWTMNAYDSTTVRNVHSGGYLNDSSPMKTNGSRPVLYLNLGTNSNLTFTKGDGTAEKPYWLGN